MADNQDPTEAITGVVNQLKNKNPFPVTDDIIRNLKTCDKPEFQRVGCMLEYLKGRDAEILKQLASLVDLLEYLRVCIKYQAFDVEATRRERDELMRQLGGGNVQ